MAFDLKPMTTGELLDRSFFLYRKHFSLFAGIAVVPMLVYFLANIASDVVISSMPAGANVLLLTPLVKLPSTLIGILAVLFTQGAAAAAISDVYLDRPYGIGKSFNQLYGNFSGVLFSMILVSIATVFGFICLIVPGIIFAAAFSLTIPAAVIEKLRPTDAMRRSWNLTKNGRERVFLIFVIVAAINFVVNFIFSVPLLVFSVIEELGDSSLPSLTQQITTDAFRFFAACITVPLSTVATSLLYYDQRARKEGFDLQFMISSLDSERNT